MMHIGLICSDDGTHRVVAGVMRTRVALQLRHKLAPEGIAPDGLCFCCGKKFWITEMKDGDTIVTVVPRDEEFTP